MPLTRRPWLRFAYLWLLPVALGAVTTCGFAPYHAWPIPILSLALLFWMCRRARPRIALWRGWLFGLGMFLAGVSWVYVSLTVYGDLPRIVAALGTLGFAAFMALFPAVALGVAAWHNHGPRRWLALPAAWVLVEWSRGWVLSGFPWLALGYAQAPDSPLIGFAPVFGVYGVSLAVAGVAALLALTFATRRIVWAIGAGGLLLLGAWLQLVMWTQPVGVPVSVTLLQGNVEQAMKFRPEKLHETLNAYAQGVLASEAQLVVLPETALPLLRSAVPGEYLDALARHMRALGGDVLIGVPEDDQEGRYYNSVTSYGASPSATYRKYHLVPFGEFAPFGFRWFVDMMKIPLGEFAAGSPTQGPIAAAGQKLAVNVCYEDAFGEERIHAARESTLLVNVSNDAWFGDSLAPRQHLQIGAMRSLESGRWQLRTNNTGITAILDHRGRVRGEIEPFTRGALNGYAQGMHGQTPYLRWGNLPVLGMLALMFLAAFWPRHARLFTPSR